MAESMAGLKDLLPKFYKIPRKLELELEFESQG